MGFWQTLRERPSRSGEARRAAEVERLAQLKESARTCRTECAAERQQEEQAGNVPSVNALASWRKRMEDAEGRYAAAVHAWDNKQWRLKT